MKSGSGDSSYLTILADDSPAFSRSVCLRRILTPQADLHWGTIRDSLIWQKRREFTPRMQGISHEYLVHRGELNG
jgi:hypothetical protein